MPGSSRAADLLRAGQRVTFAAEPSERGPRAVHVEAGKSAVVPLAPDVAVVRWLGVLLLAATLLFRFGAGWSWWLSWLLAINPVTFAAFALDKRRAILGARRVPERTLLGLALLGGTPSAALAMPLLKHKTRKGSFRLAFAAVVTVQVGGAGGGVVVLGTVRKAGSRSPVHFGHSRQVRWKYRSLEHLRLPSWSSRR